jgi:hypothetical protein
LFRYQVSFERPQLTPIRIALQACWKDYRIQLG